MRLFAATVISFLLPASAFAQTEADPVSQTVTITRSGSQPSTKAPAEHFTGSVRIDPLFQASEPSRTSGAQVTFEPGARTAWHTHPLGQILIVTAGSGRVQAWGGPIEEIRPGDVVRIPPGRKHWHGAAPLTAMTHIAIQENLGGKTVDWLEKVSDAQYGDPPPVHPGGSASGASDVRSTNVEHGQARRMCGDIALNRPSSPTQPRFGPT